MSTLRPFVLSSLALHLLGVGLLLFWMFSPPAVYREEIKVLTVMLVSEESSGGGQEKAEIASPSARNDSLNSAIASPPRFGSGRGSAATKQSQNKAATPSFPELNQRHEIPLTDKSQGVAKIVTTPSGASFEEKTSIISKSEGPTGAGISGGPGSSPGGGGGKMAGLPGTGGGEGAGTGDGNGWGLGGDDRLYLLGGYQVTPRYPASARRQGREGTAFLKIKISPEGKVLEVLVAQSSGHQDLDEAAVEAVKTWRFQPPKKGEQKVSLWARVPVKFQLRK